ncbi:MAG: site-specific integrase [Bacteroides sp.]|nr:site-specific integrase [Bacillota bacterium]MCM1393498.1 site-specific integrase [[Eubacterium] siraeum]MCM1455091.1 site-specific integrase [Bacteroides sp.]
MRDILIEFLIAQLKEQQKICQATASFIAGLTGEPPERYLQSDAFSPSSVLPSATRAPFFNKRDKYTSSDGLLRLTYSQDDPGAKKTFLALSEQTYRGGDEEYSQVVSNPKKEDDTMKYLSKRADGRWVARKTVNGKRIYVYGKTQIEARDKLRAALGKAPSNEPKREQLGKFAKWWLETYKRGNVSDGTYKNYAWTISAHLANITTPINKLTTVQLQELINKLPPSRIRKEVYKLIRQIVRKAYELDYIKKDVSEFLTVGKVEHKSRESLTLDEQRKLVGALGNDLFSRRVLFYLCTGARPSEIATVRKEEIRPGWIKINGTKTKSAVRWVKVSEKLSTMLAGESPEFFNFDNKRFRQRLQRFCESNGICKTIDVYTLRHTYATNLYILRVPEKDRQTYLGHTAGSTMTNDVYTTFSPDTVPSNIYDIYGDFLPRF